MGDIYLIANIRLTDFHLPIIVLDCLKGASCIAVRGVGVGTIRKSASVHVDGKIETA